MSSSTSSHNNRKAPGTSREKARQISSAAVQKIAAGARKHATNAHNIAKGKVSSVKKQIQVRKVHGSKSRKKTIKNTLSPEAAISIAVAVLVLIFVIPSARRHKAARIRTGDGIPNISYNALGIDISHNNQGEIHWDSLCVCIDKDGKTTASVKAAKQILPIKFVYIKATEGTRMVDSKFKENWRKAGERDIARGAYHFFLSSKNGYVQAQNFINAVGPLRHDDLPPVLDIETLHSEGTYDQLNTRALQWLKEVEFHYHVKPVVYTSAGYAKNHLSKEITENYPLWIAHYGVDKPEIKNWSIWQFTDNAVVIGIQGAVDLNISH